MPRRSVDCENRNGCNVSTSAPGTCWAVEEVLLKDKQGKRIKSLGARIEKSIQFIRDVTHPHFECLWRPREQGGQGMLRPPQNTTPRNTAHGEVWAVFGGGGLYSG